MNAILYSIKLQFKMDIRSKTMLITSYIVPLLFFAVMGTIFTSLIPEAKDTLIQSMSIMGISMGALIGLPPSLVELYGTDMKKMYIANGVPMSFGIITLCVSACIHLIIMSLIIFITAPIAFGAKLPLHIPLYFASLVLFIIVSLSVACILGLFVKNQAKLTMYCQLLFLPSIMLSGIMFSADLLPHALYTLGKLFPATWGFTLLTQNTMQMETILPLLSIFCIAIFLSYQRLKNIRTE